MSLYSPLNSTLKEIRRLTLTPLSSGPGIQCSTSVKALLSNLDFEALSYVWGPPSQQQTITFNSVPTQVTRNLYTALTYLRLPDKPRYLWVDALCINQQDVKERNEQVSMMDEIYACASPVLIFIGEADEDSEEGFSLISKELTDTNITQEISQKLFSFFMELVEREWFTRLWTIQELVLATQDPLVGCGHTWTTWGTLVSVWQKAAMIEFSKAGMVVSPDKNEKKGENEETPSSGVQSARSADIKIDLLNNLRSGVHERGGEDLYDLLLNTNSSNATEPRDRIYGLLGMLSPSARQDITVDYSRPIGAVFAEAVAHIFQKGKGVFLLSGMELMGPSLDPTFPSWVPQFGHKTLLKPTRFHPAGIGASGAGADAVNGTVSPDLKTLSVRGLPIDIVVKKLSFGKGKNCLARLPHVQILAQKASELAKSHEDLNPDDRPYLNAFKIKEPLWRTLIANKAYSGRAREEAPEAYAEMYQNLLDTQGNGTENRDEGFEDAFIRDYRLCLLNMLPGNCFFITATGFCGIGPDFLEVGDQLAVWFGAPAPFILRTVSDVQARDRETNVGERVYNVCGVAYVAGIMDGEIVDEVYCEDLEDDVLFILH